MPVPDARALGRRPAVEPLEQVRQVLGAECRGRDRAPRGSARRRRCAARTSMAEPAGVYCAAFSSRCASAAAVRRGSSRTGSSGSRLTTTDVRLQRCARPGRAPPRRSPTDAPSAGSVSTAPASMRAISRMFWNSRVSRSTSARMTSRCSDRSSGDERRRVQVARRHADGGQRRAQIVADRGEQRRLQLLALAGQLAGLALRRATAPARSRWPPRPASVSSVPASTGRPAAASRPIGLVPTRSGTRRTSRPSTSAVRWPA